MGQILGMALGLIEEGFSVLPIGEGKKPRAAWADFAERVPTGAEVEELFRLDGVTGIATICGPVSALAVLDIDQPDMLATMRSLIRPEVRAAVPWYRTTRGFHLWFVYPAQWAGEAPKAMLSRDGVDLLLYRHYAICPPRASAANFSGCAHGGVRASLLPVPPGLLAWFGEGASKSSRREAGEQLRGSALFAYFVREGRAPVPEGERNRLLFRVACYVHGARMGANALGQLIGQAVEVDGLSLDEATQCAESAARKVEADRGRYGHGV